MSVMYPFLQKLSSHGVAKNTVYQLIGKVFTALSTLVVVRLVTTYYGENGAADFTLITVFLNNIFYLLTDFGINAIAVKQMVENEENEGQTFRALYGLRLVATVVLALLGILIVTFLPFNEATNTGFSPIFKISIYLLALTIITQGVYLTATAVFQKRLSYGKPTLALAVGSIVTLLIFWLFAKPNAPLYIPMLGFLVGNFITAFLAIILLPYAFKEKFLPLFSFATSKRLLLPALPIAATLLLNVVYFKSDSFILASLMPREDVGIYGIAYKIFEQGIVVPIFFVNALYPVLLNQFTFNKTKLPKTLALAASILLTGGLILGLTEIILAPWLVSIVAKGESFGLAVVPLRILALGLPFFFVSNVFLWLLVTLGKQKHLIWIYGSTMVVNIIGNLLLIPQYSYIASAVLTGISEALVLALTMGFGLYFLRKELRKSVILSDLPASRQVSEKSLHSNLNL